MFQVRPPKADISVLQKATAVSQRVSNNPSAAQQSVLMCIWPKDIFLLLSFSVLVFCSRSYKNVTSSWDCTHRQCASYSRCILPFILQVSMSIFPFLYVCSLGLWAVPRLALRPGQLGLLVCLDAFSRTPLDFTAWVCAWPLETGLPLPVSAALVQTEVSGLGPSGFFWGELSGISDTLDPVPFMGKVQVIPGSDPPFSSVPFLTSPPFSLIPAWLPALSPAPAPETPPVRPPAVMADSELEGQYSSMSSARVSR